MRKTILEKYYLKGWLKCQSSFYSAEDRLRAGRFFSRDFQKSRILSEGVRDLSKPFVDGSKGRSTIECKLSAKDKFIKAFLSIPPGQRKIVEHVVIDEREMKKEGIKGFKKLLCEGLDYLAYFYEKRKEDNNEK